MGLRINTELLRRVVWDVRDPLESLMLSPPDDPPDREQVSAWLGGATDPFEVARIIWERAKNPTPPQERDWARPVVFADASFLTLVLPVSDEVHRLFGRATREIRILSGASLRQLMEAIRCFYDTPLSEEDLEAASQAGIRARLPRKRLQVTWKDLVECFRFQVDVIEVVGDHLELHLGS